MLIRHPLSGQRARVLFLLTRLFLSFQLATPRGSSRFFSLAFSIRSAWSPPRWATLLHFIVMQRGHFYYDRANISRFRLAASAFIARGRFYPRIRYPLFITERSRCGKNSVRRVEWRTSRKVEASNILESRFKRFKRHKKILVERSLLCVRYATRTFVISEPRTSEIERRDYAHNNFNNDNNNRLHCHLLCVKTFFAMRTEEAPPTARYVQRFRRGTAYPLMNDENRSPPEWDRTLLAGKGLLSSMPPYMIP